MTAVTMTIISIAVFIPVYLNTHSALRGIETRYVELAETLRLSRASFVRQVILPGALPGFLLGLRFGVTNAWLALVVVEHLPVPVPSAAPHLALA